MEPFKRADNPPRRIRDLFEHRNFGAWYLSSTLEFLHFLTRLGLKPKEDGWRKFSTAFLRTEDSRFTLAVFRLRVEDSARQAILEKISHWLIDHPQLWNTCLAWTRRSARVEPNERLDLVWADFDEHANLTNLRFFPDLARGRAFDAADSPHAPAFIRAYNQTRLAGRQRPYLLLEVVKKTAPAALEFARRVLNGVFVRFEKGTPDKRFDLPDFSAYPHPGGGALHILCRLQPNGEIDLWFHVSHVLQDGIPVLEALAALNQSWGRRETLVLPAPAKSQEERGVLHPVHNECGREMTYVQQALSFESLLEARKKLNEKYADRLDGNITVAGMILWGLGQHPFLRDAKMTTVVDVPPLDGQPRTLGFVPSKPGSFVNEDREVSFIAYQNYLNRAIERTRQRADLTYAALRGHALAPISSYEMTFASMPQVVRDIGGTATLTLIPTAEYVAANTDETRDALIAIGNFTLPTETGERGGMVGVKAVQEDALRYWEAVFNAVMNWKM